MSDLGDDLGIEPGAAPAAGAPPAGPSVDDLKGENANLRAENRRLHAEGLAAKHGLSPTQAELLGMVPKDQQQAKAEALAAERGPAAPAPTGEAAPTEPENADQIAAMQDQPPPATPPAAPAPGSEDAMVKRIAEADIKSLKDLEALQQQMRGEQQG